jgi:hypothetical protein
MSFARIASEPRPARLGFLAESRLRFCAVGLFCLCVVANFWFARAAPFNSDMVQSYNELASIWAGNFALHGWDLATNNYYLTDLPWYVLCGALLGRTPDLIYIVPALIFSMTLLAAVLIVRTAGKTAFRRDFGTCAILILIGFPFAAPQGSLLESGVHGATIMLALYGVWLAQQLLSEPPVTRWLLLPFSMIVFAAAGSDPQADSYFVAPLILLPLIRLWLHPRFRLNEWALAACTLVASGLGVGFIAYLSHHGGFQIEKNYSLGFVASAGAMVENLHALLRAVQMVFDARPIVLLPFRLHRVIAASRFLTLLAVVALCLRVVWQAPRAPERAFVQVLVLGALCLGALDMMSGMFAAILFGKPDMPVFVIRYVMPAYIFVSLAAVIEAGTLRIERKAVRQASAAVALICAGLFMCGVAQAVLRALAAPSSVAAAPQRDLAIWLQARGLTYGVGDYWTTQMVTALSRGDVKAEPVIAPEGRLIPYPWVGDMADADAGRKPQFVAYLPGNIFGVMPGTILAAYGKPLETDQVGNYQVALFQR